MRRVQERFRDRAIRLSWYLTPGARIALAVFYGISVASAISASYDGVDIFGQLTFFIGLQGILTILVFLNADRGIQTHSYGPLATKIALWGVLVIGLALSTSSPIELGEDPSRELRAAAELMPAAQILLTLSALALLPWVTRRAELAQHGERLRARLDNRRSTNKETLR